MSAFYNISFYKIASLICILSFALIACEENEVETDYENIYIEVLEEQDRINVMAGEKLFTSYLYTDTLDVLQKPVLYPIYTSHNSYATRGYPIEPRPGERVNYPHHIGLWLAHADVNGVDFWNSGDPDAEENNYGTIRHNEIISFDSGEQEGVIEVEKQWMDDDGQVLLTEGTRYVFRAQDRFRSIDRITTLNAMDNRIELRDQQEGFIAVRASTPLELPADEPLILIGEDGRTMTEPVTDPDNRNGVFHNSEGSNNMETYGQRADWVSLSAIDEFEPVTIAIFDHPDNPGYPAYWNPQSYGLLSSNPFGRQFYSDSGESLNLAIEPGESVTFRHRIVVEADLLIASDLNEYYDAFVQEVR